MSSAVSYRSDLSDDSEDDESKIVFAAVTSSTTILARFSPYDGNFDEIVEQILQRTSMKEGKVTFMANSDPE